MKMSEVLRKKADDFYRCADEMGAEAKILTDARELLLKYADQYSGAADLAASKEEKQ